MGSLVKKPLTELSRLAKEWQDSGNYVKWTSTLEENEVYGELNVFSIQKGNPENPAILMIHGYPTMSFDFFDVVGLLSDDYYVCAIDTIGYGLSDKPRDGYIYSIEDDAKLVDYYITDILMLKEFTLLTHDKGDSVGLSLLSLYRNQDFYRISHHIITNGNIYLPLANLTRFQKMLLSEKFGQLATNFINGKLLAKGLNRKAHTIPEKADKINGVASIIDYQDGGKVQHSTIQYLNQRTKYEEKWLDNLKESEIPTTLFWGVDDRIAPVAVADYVWQTVLKDRSTEAYYWRLPNANHYLMNDNPHALNLVVRQVNGEVVEWDSLPEGERPVLLHQNPGW
ncbi:MAG: hypothetical protein A2Y20_09950 [Firmicutes bacterium GWF2_51_9]|nr:MAG: hypothetical protein A2Y20_09950 [Firmicutes bacterium GWF2_51_9]OGS59336.1 MAG: hypothetical protein A2Y19_09065 [Firmicutes bacterium GWE2_51_13]HAM62380.1 alpha/beta hydrolase [Erysipelotrichaceae bacterium]HBZ40293.1 alpha/beta hydrolase [Erysipelotrichaceae bacterium]